MKSYSIITILPHLVEAYKELGVFRAATEKGLATIAAINLRDFAMDKHGTVDGPPYGGGDGMVLRPEPISEALKSHSEKAIVICPSPGGKLWSQREALYFAEQSRPISFVCGRFGGIDQRIIDTHVDYEFSLGDFILSGGELPALAMLDSILRFIPGVLGHSASAEQDSFGDVFEGGLEYPLYTRPEEFEGHKVPEVLLSGNHKKIAAWRAQKSKERTVKNRPDLIK